MNNNRNNNDTKTIGVGFTGLLTIAFIVLKLVGVIDWSWVWVLSPMWISFGVGAVLVTIAIVLAWKVGR